MSRNSRRVRRPPRHRKGPRHVIIARGDNIRSFQLKARWLLLGGVAVIAMVGGAAYGGNVYLETRLAEQATAAASAAASAEAGLRGNYEAQIATLNQQIDTLVGQQITDRSAIEDQIAELAQRQQALNERQQLLTGLANDAFAVGIDVIPANAPLPVANPLRTGVTIPATAAPAIGGPLDPMTTGAIDAADGPFDPDELLAGIARAGDVIEADQMAAIDELGQVAEERASALATALQSLGYNGGGTGGPYVPYEGDHEDLTSIANDIADLAALQRYARQLPLGQPLTTLSITSNFGPRRDPFLGSSAMHTGLDLAAVTGTQVRATGPGRVVFAGTNGGYGRMVEIDHGNGVSTLYGHLNSISVHVGDTVAAGDVIARSGSTGRSTGPHLHYEIRRNDRPIDPLPHVRTGAQILRMLN